MKTPLIFALFVLLAGSKASGIDDRTPVEEERSWIEEYLSKKHHVEVMRALRELHIALSSYVTENRTWPQCPFDEGKEPEKYTVWWKKALEPYGIEENVWRTHGLVFRPAAFKEGMREPYRVAGSKWVTATGEIVKKRVTLQTLADGSIKSTAEGDEKKPGGKEKELKPARLR